MNRDLPVWPEADPSIVAPVAEHDELRNIVRSLLEAEAGHEKVREAAESDLGWSQDLWKRLNQELDLGSMIVPEALGGAGFGLRDVAVVLEETGAALLPEPVLMSLAVAPHVLALSDHSADVQELLAGVSSGKLIATIALEGEVDVVGHTVTGTLSRVPGAASSNVVIFAHESGIYAADVKGASGSLREREVMDVTRRQADITFDRTPVVTIHGSAGAAELWAQVRRAVTILVAAEHVGITRRQLDETLAYLNQREQFGRKIGSFQAVKHRMADVLVDLERARSAVVYAAALYDVDPDAELAAEVAGAVATDVVIRAVHEAVQLHGGIGFTWEHPAHYYVKRALGDEGLFGAARSHRQQIAELIGI